MKKKFAYQCSVCNAQFSRWFGKCPSCGEWNTLSLITFESKNNLTVVSYNENIQQLSSISIPEQPRINTKIYEFDRTLGGGIVPGSVVLLAGEPGIGKSTLLLQVLDLLKVKSFYISGEESPQQLKLRADRLGISSPLIYIANETNLDAIEKLIFNSNSEVIVIDSIQTVYSEKINSPSGSVLQVRECTQKLMQISKSTNKILFLIGHVNKDGNIAGPKALEHIVDTVLLLEGERNSNIRVLRALKNRFGSTLEIGIFEMSFNGLHEILDTEKIFFSHSSIDHPGVAFIPIIEGARCLIFEIQILVSLSNYSIPQRNVNGYDFKRLQTILAVLDRKLSINLRQSDIFVNVVGGVFIQDTGVDLGLALGLVSSWKERAIGSKVAVFGEIGLTGEIRNVQLPEKRLQEAENLGFSKVILPKASKLLISKSFNLELFYVDQISEAIERIF
ncbi:MAG: DNA repair protein RadA [Candidatus Kapaibacteriales bacterium]